MERDGEREKNNFLSLLFPQAILVLFMIEGHLTSPTAQHLKSSSHRACVCAHVCLLGFNAHG